MISKSGYRFWLLVRKLERRPERLRDLRRSISLSEAPRAERTATHQRVVLLEPRYRLVESTYSPERQRQLPAAVGPDTVTYFLRISHFF